MWMYDLVTLRFLDVNEAAVRQYGYSKNEFLAMTIQEIRPEQELPRLAESIDRNSAVTQAHSAGIWRHRKKDGSVFSVEIMTHPFVYHGRAAEMVFAVDVDARIRSEAERRERSDLAVLVAESADALAGADSLRAGLQRCAEFLNRHIGAIFVRIWTLGNDPGVLELKASAGGLTSVDDEYSRIPVGQPGIGKIAENGVPVVDNDIRNSGWLADLEIARRWNPVAFVCYPLTVETRMVGVAAAFAARPLTGPAVQAFTSIVRVMAQFIERKHGEESVQSLAALVENSSDAIVMATFDGKISFMNHAGLNLLGLQKGEAVGLEISRLHPPEAWAVIERELLPACVQTGHWKGESQLRHFVTGESIDVLLSAFLVRDAAGKPISKAAVMHDIRDRKQVEDALRSAKEAAESASRLKSEFLANMSHEIRTPMNGIMAMTDLALDTELTAEQQDYLETVKMSADTLLRILNDILDFSKIEAGKMDLENICFDLHGCLQEATNLMLAPASQKGLTLACDIAPDVPRTVRGDPVRLRQVILNLIGNSVKFTASGGIAVRAEPDGSHAVHFSVRDTGIGIPAEKQRAIFDAFSQADGSITRRFGGTGLGLSISARLVHLMGGRIWLESNPGEGATFHFTAGL